MSYKKFVSLLIAASFLLASFDLQLVSAQSYDIAGSGKLQVQSIWRPITEEGHAVSGQLRFEALLGIRLLYGRRGDGLQEVNLALTRMYEARARALRRKPWAKKALELGAIEFASYTFDEPRRQITGIFRFKNDSGRLFEITYTDNPFISYRISRLSSSGADSASTPNGRHVKTISLPYFVSGLPAPNRVIKKDSLAADLTSTAAAAVIEEREGTGIVTANTPNSDVRRIKDSLDGAVKRIIEKLIYIRGARVRFTVSEGIGRDHVLESFAGGDIVGVGDGTPYFVAIDCIEGTNATASNRMGIGGSGGTSVVVEGQGVGSLGFAPDIYANLIITHVPPDKVQQFKSSPLDPDAPDSDGEEAVYAKVISELKRIAEANGIGVADLEVVIMIRGREVLKEKVLKRIEDEYPGFSITRIEDGTLMHGIDASLGRKSAKHKVLWTVGGLPEGFMNLLSAKPFRDTGAVAGLRIYSKNINNSPAGKDTAVDMNWRYDFSEDEISEIERLRPQDHREIINGAKLFTLEDIEGPVDASFSFITDNGIFGIPAVRVEGDKYRVATLRIREIEGKGYLWLEDILVSGFVQIQKAQGRVAQCEMEHRKAVESGQAGPSIIGELEENLKAAKKELEDAIGKVSKKVLVVVNGEEVWPDEPAAGSETRFSASGTRPQKSGLPISEIAGRLGLKKKEWQPYTDAAAKIEADLVLKRLENKPNGNLILVTAINPTVSGEGKTCTSISLTQGLGKLGCSVALGLRQPSEGPVYGLKGGAMGKDMARVEPEEWINSRFTGDIDAIAVANNLAAAAIANHLYRTIDGQINKLGIDKDRIVFPRAIDLNDASLRNVTVGQDVTILGRSFDIEHKTEWIITVASEVMAILAIAEDIYDLRERIDKIIVAYNREGKPVTVKDIGVGGAMAHALRYAIKPNLVQTLEGQPVIVHAGPFGNIAHGCNSLIADRLGLKLADYFVTEAGFGADLGAEKFLDIVCRQGGLKPKLAVIVATAKALIEHGKREGEEKKAIGDFSPAEQIDRLKRGLANLDRHVKNMGKFGLPVLVAINKFPGDRDEQLRLIMEHCDKLGVRAEINDGVAKGGEGAVDLAKAAVEIIGKGKADFKPLYDLEMPIREKIETIAREIYGADGVDYVGTALEDINRIDGLGYANLPICMAKTQYSFTHNPALKGAPSGWMLEIREVRLSAGVGFIVPVTGDISLMPAMPLSTSPNFERQFGDFALRASAPKQTRSSASGSELKTSEPSAAEPPGNIKLLPVNDAEEMARKVAEAVIARVREANTANRKVVLGLATGGTMEGVYRWVVDITEKEKIDWSRVVTFNLDEYKWFSASDSQSYRAYMDEHLFSRLDRFGFKMQNAHIFNGMTLNDNEEIENFLAKIDEEGGIDLQILGIGNDCHFAFIEPAAIVGRGLYRSLKEGSLSIARNGLLEKIRDFNDFIMPKDGLSDNEIGDFINRIVKERNNLLRGINRDNALVEYARQMRQKEGKNDLSEDDIRSQLQMLGESLCRRPVRFYVEGFNSGKRSGIERVLLETSVGYKAGQIILHDAKNFSPPRAKMVNMALPTILANSRYFPGLTEVPTQAFTLAGAVKEANSIILAATGADKAGAVEAAISSNPSVEAPASTLQTHPDITFIVTEDALTAVPQGIREKAERNYAPGRSSAPRLPDEEQEPRDVAPKQARGSASGQMTVHEWGQRIVADLFAFEGLDSGPGSIKVEGLGRLPREELLDAIWKGTVTYDVERQKWILNNEPADAATLMGVADWFRPDLLTKDISIGVPKEIKKNEGRIGLTPYGVAVLRMMGIDKIFVESGAGLYAGFSDEAYEQLGATIVETAEEAWKAKLIVKVKEPLSSEYDFIRPDHTIFTYFHLASQENRGLTEGLMRRSLGAAVAYETIEHNGGTPLLAPMSEIAGKLAAYWAGFYISRGTDDVQGALLEETRKAISRDYPNMSIKDRPLPLLGRSAVVLGGGVVGLNAALSMAQMGAAVTVTETNPRKRDEIEREFSRNGLTIAVLNPDAYKAAVEGLLSNADIIVGGVYKKGERAPLIIDEALLGTISAGRPKFIVDVAIDQGGNVWGSKTTYYDNPVFVDNFGNMRFCVANMPSLVPRYASMALEDAKIRYLLALACGLEEVQGVYPELAGGVNILDGALVSGEIAAAHGLPLTATGISLRPSASGSASMNEVPNQEDNLDELKTAIQIASDIGEELRKMAEARFVDETHLVFVQEAMPLAQRNATAGLIYRCREYYQTLEGYTVDVVADYEKAIELVASHPDWDKTNTIVGPVRESSLEAIASRLAQAGLKDKAKFLAVGELEEDRFLPLKTLFDLMAAVVRINKPLDGVEDQDVLDRIRDLLVKIGARDVKSLMETFTTAEFFQDPIKFARHFIVRLLPPIKRLDVRERKELYEAARSVVESL